MQPLNQKLTRKSNGLARVKMLIRVHLYWMQGFPVYENKTIVWCSTTTERPGFERIKITDKMLSKSQRVINELIKDYKHALPLVVGDPQSWKQRSIQYLKFHKSIMQNQSQCQTKNLFDLDKDFGDKYLKIRHSDSNKELINALSWMHYIESKPLKKAFGFLDQYKDKIKTRALSLEPLLQLCYLHIKNGVKAKGMTHLLFNTAAINVITAVENPQGFAKYIRCKIPKANKKTKVKKLDFGKATSSGNILSLMQWVVAQKQIKQKTALLLIDSLDLTGLILKWQAWWLKAMALCEKIENIVIYKDASQSQKLKTLQKKLNNLHSKIPGNLKLKQVIASIKLFSNNKSVSHSLIKAFTALSNKKTAEKYNYPLKVEFIQYFSHLFLQEEIKTTDFCHYLLLFTKHINAHPQCTKKSPWANLSDYYWGSIESDLFEDLKVNQYQMFFAIIGELLKNKNYTTHVNRWIISLIATEFSIQRTINIVGYLVETNQLDYATTVVSKMIRHYDLNNNQIVRLIKIWNKFDEEYTDEDTLEVMFNSFLENGLDDLFMQLLFTGHAKQLRLDCYKVRIVKKLMRGAQLFPEINKVKLNNGLWIKQYPYYFTPMLTQINALTDAAQKKTEKIFQAHWWTRTMLENQIITLEKQLEKQGASVKDKLTPRLNNLRKKLINHQDMNENEKLKIANKISVLISAQKYKNWQQNLSEKFEYYWSAFFKLTHENRPSWFFDTNTIQKIMPIIDFNTKNKQLAIQVIRNRCLTHTNNDWQFLNHPKNQQFLLKLNTLGVNAQAWIKGIGNQIYQTKHQASIELSICKDPLELLNMGAYFKTCLSPTSFNYFSVFANIADINKQVIYATNEKGKVVGRVLIGITDRGGLLIYHRYYHNASDDFLNASTQYIEKLAKETGLILSDEDEVSCLVSHDWYDDGSINVDNGITCFAKDSLFRKEIEGIGPQNFTTQLKQHLMPKKINTMTFSLLIYLPEIKTNKKLFPILINMAQQTNHLLITDTIQLYKLSHEMGYCHYYSYFRDKLIRYQSKNIKENQTVDVDVAHLMVKDNPSDALKLIKKYARKYSKNWREHLGQNKYEIAVTALKLLDREQQAEEINAMYSLES